jgi:O-antigen/teichoic acid export membrane protein
MATTPVQSIPVRSRLAHPPSRPQSRQARVPAPRRIASNFAALSLAEVVCRGTSVVVTLSLAQSLGATGYGRIEFAFNVVFWLVLIVRDTFEGVVVRELARHPRLIRPLVNHVLAVKGVIALGLFAGLVLFGNMMLGTALDRQVLALYGLLLITTALGLDFVYRGTERMGLIALSLCIRTLVYAVGVWSFVTDATQIAWVPAWLAMGEACGIGLVWVCYARQYGLPRPVLGLRFLRVFFRRGRSVCLIQVAQTVIGSADLMVVGLLKVVGLLSLWADVGRYGATHRMITALLTFGLIFQQVSFPTLARSWRQTDSACRESLNALIEVLMLVLIPIAVGGAVLAFPLVRFLLPRDYIGASLLLLLGIWRAPLLTLAFLYQSTLIAVNRESAGVRLLLVGALISGPLVVASCGLFGLPGASVAVLLIALGLAVAGYLCLAREGRQPAWHHHLGRPLAASLAMLPACLVLQHWHVLAAIAGGAVSYAVTLIALGGLHSGQIHALICRDRGLVGA